MSVPIRLGEPKRLDSLISNKDSSLLGVTVNSMPAGISSGLLAAANQSYFTPEFALSDEQSPSSYAFSIKLICPLGFGEFKGDSS